MDLQLADKTVLVTGGASNIGRSISMKFADEGAVVIIVDIDEDQADKTIIDIKNNGGEAKFYKTDVTNQTEVVKLIADVAASFDVVDVLVNNVGWSGRLGYFLSLGPERWEKAYRRNLLPVFHLTQEVLPLMMKQKHGSIISIASDTGFGMTHTAEYGAMKAGVMNFSRSIAIEYGRYGIRSNVVAPGLVIPDEQDIGDGSFWKDGIGYSDKEVSALEAQVPMRLRPAAEDIAASVVFFASESARVLTGQILSVSGGYMMPR